MKEIETQVADFGNFIETEIKKEVKGKYIVWRFDKIDGKLKIVYYRLADNTDRQTLDEYHCKGWFIIEG